MEDGIVEILDEDFEFLNLGPAQQQSNPVPNVSNATSNDLASTNL
jgi:hypothetical protein